MNVMILREEGYGEALLGLSLSHGITVERAAEVAKTLALKDGGHNKFLEAILVWLDVVAPRHWWQEADTYRIATKQSESTMHTIHKRNLEQGDFEFPIYQPTLDYLNYLRRIYDQDRSPRNLVALKNELPEGFLQRRVWVLSYKTIRNMVAQRHDHRQPDWREILIPYLLDNLQHPEFVKFTKSPFIT